MFEHLFVSYENVTPPPKNEESEEKEITLTQSYDNPLENLINNIIYPQDYYTNQDSTIFLDDDDQFMQDYFKQSNLERTDLKNPLLVNQNLKKPTKASSKITASQKFTSEKEFARVLTANYRKALVKKGLDPNFAPILTAQAALESGWGKHLAGAYNYGGIKSKTGTTLKTREYSKEKGYYNTTATFRNFKSIEDYCDYRVSLLSNSRYNVFKQFNPTQVSKILTHVVNKGYATAPASKYVPTAVNCYNKVIKYLK